MTPEVHAWLLDLGYGHRTAVAPRHMAEYVFDPALHAVPLAQAHLRGVTRWRGLLVPLVDLAVLLGEPRIEVERRRAVILAYRTAEDAPVRFGRMARNRAVVFLPRRTTGPNPEHRRALSRDARRHGTRTQRTPCRRVLPPGRPPPPRR